MKAWVLCTASALCLLLDTASAQDRLPSASLGRGLPSAALEMRTPTASPPRDLFVVPSQVFAPTFEQPPSVDPRFFPCCGVFFGGPVFFRDSSPFPGAFPGFANELGPVAPAWARRPVPPVEQLGYLRLLVEPGTAQAFIDGFFVGTVDDLRRQLSLEPGPHHVELRAEGYDVVAFEVRIVPGETVTYRADLTPVDKPAAPAPGTPKTFYVIPRCYAGDRPPEQAALRPGCDIRQLRTIPPLIR